MDRLDFWRIAAELVDPIIQEHGLEEYRSGSPLAYTNTTTKVDQHIDQIMRVAEWFEDDRSTIKSQTVVIDGASEE